MTTMTRRSESPSRRGAALPAPSPSFRPAVHRIHGQISDTGIISEKGVEVLKLTDLKSTFQIIDAMVSAAHLLKVEVNLATYRHNFLKKDIV